MGKNAPRPVDGGRAIDWGKTSQDYSVFRPGPPESFYRKLLALDVGLGRQRILDLGTGTGVLARRFAKQGSVAVGIDISREQIRAAKILAEVPIRFTRDTWKGRIRACRGIGAALAPSEVQRFDEEHDTLLRSIAGEEFTVLHQIGCHMFTFRA